MPVDLPEGASGHVGAVLPGEFRADKPETEIRLGAADIHQEHDRKKSRNIQRIDVRAARARTGRAFACQYLNRSVRRSDQMPVFVIGCRCRSLAVEDSAGRPKRSPRPAATPAICCLWIWPLIPLNGHMKRPAE